MAEPSVWDEGGTYVATDATCTDTVTHEWNHGIGEVISALITAGLQVTGFVEHDSAPSEALPGRMARGDDEEWRITRRPERLPLTYTLQAVKTG